MSSFEFINISKSFGKKTILSNINFKVAKGEFIVILGPSGSGKTTLLNLIAGFEKPDGGELLMNEKDVTSLPTDKRRIGMVFQKYTLYPNKSVEKNIAFPLEIQPISSTEFESDRAANPSLSKKQLIRQRVEKLAKRLNIEPLLTRNPHQLSGGQMQRVAIGRALVRNMTDTILMDEPFSSLDAGLRSQLQHELREVIKEKNLTVFFVTHDQAEAMKLADRIILLNDGDIQQVGTPKQLYDYPCNKFVGSFFGTPQMNFIPCFTNEKLTDIAFDFSAEYPQKVIAGLRPNFIKFSKENTNDIRLSYTLGISKFQGHYYEIHGEIGGTPVIITSEIAADNEVTNVYIDKEKLLFFDPDSPDNPSKSLNSDF